MTTIKNVMDKVRVETDPYKGNENVVSFFWDFQDKKVNDIMSKDFKNELTQTKKKSCMWVNKVKEHAKWEYGETLHIFTDGINIHGEGCTRAYWYKEGDERFEMISDITVDSNGFIYMKTYNLYTNFGKRKDADVLHIRVNSVYNKDRLFIYGNFGDKIQLK